jgi:hypothetical protein
MESAGSVLGSALPIACRATEAWVVTEDGTARWRIHSRFPFADA